MGRYDDYLLVSDFDRTLTSRRDSIPAANLAAIDNFLREGGAFTVATGRSVPLFRSRQAAVPHNAPLILFNGAVCYDYEQEQALYCQAMPPDCRDVAAQLARDYPALRIEVQNLTGHYPIGAPSGDTYAIAQGVPTERLSIGQIPQPFLKFILIGPFTPSEAFPDFFVGCSEQEEAYYADLCAALAARYPGYSCIRSAPRMIEMQAAGVSKGVAALALKRQLGRKTLICVGDAPNDLPMLLSADRAFVPASGSPALLQQGFDTADDCDRGAIASVIAAL